MFKRKGGGSKAFWTMFKKTALFSRDGFPYQNHYYPHHHRQRKGQRFSDIVPQFEKFLFIIIIITAIIITKITKIIIIRITVVRGRVRDSRRSFPNLRSPESRNKRGGIVLDIKTMRRMVTWWWCRVWRVLNQGTKEEPGDKCTILEDISSGDFFLFITLFFAPFK